MKKIIYTSSNGGVSIVSPLEKEKVGSFIPEVLNMTDDQYLEFILKKDVPSDATDAHIVDDSDLPPSREHRFAWKIEGKKVKVDQVKVQAKIQSDAQKKAEKNAIFDKMKISPEEFEKIKKGS